MAKFANEEEYQKAVHKINWESTLAIEYRYQELKTQLINVPHKTNHLRDALFLLQMVKEKVEQHNAVCKQTAGKMKTVYYKRNNIANY